MAVFTVAVFRQGPQGLHQTGKAGQRLPFPLADFKDHTDDTLFTIDGASHTSRKAGSSLTGIDALPRQFAVRIY